MDAEEIRQKYQSTFDGVVTGAKGKLHPDIAQIVSQLVHGAAREAEGLDEWLQERAVGEGVAAYRKLAEKLVAAAKTLTMFPDVNKHAWDLALMQLGPNPPYYFP